MDKDKLREEFYKSAVVTQTEPEDSRKGWDYTDIYYSKEEIALYWLSKFDSILQEKVERLEKERKNSDYAFQDPSFAFDEGFDNGIDLAIKIINNE